MCEWLLAFVLCPFVSYVNAYVCHGKLLWLMSPPAVLSVDQVSIWSDKELALARSVASILLQLPLLLPSRRLTDGIDPNQDAHYNIKWGHAVWILQGDTPYANTHIRTVCSCGPECLLGNPVAVALWQQIQQAHRDTQTATYGLVDFIDSDSDYWFRIVWTLLNANYLSTDTFSQDLVCHTVINSPMWNLHIIFSF